MHSIRLPQRGRVGKLRTTIKPKDISLSFRNVGGGVDEVTPLLSGHAARAPLVAVDEDEVNMPGARRPDTPAHRPVGKPHRAAAARRLSSHVGHLPLDPDNCRTERHAENCESLL